MRRHYRDSQKYVNSQNDDAIPAEVEVIEQATGPEAAGEAEAVRAIEDLMERAEWNARKHAAKRDKLRQLLNKW